MGCLKTFLFILPLEIFWKKKQIKFKIQNFWKNLKKKIWKTKTKFYCCLVCGWYMNLCVTMIAMMFDKNCNRDCNSCQTRIWFVAQYSNKPKEKQQQQIVVKTYQMTGFRNIWKRCLFVALTSIHWSHETWINIEDNMSIPSNIEFSIHWWFSLVFSNKILILQL